MTLEGNKKFYVAVVALVVVGVVGAFGPLTGDQVTAMMQWAVPTIVGLFTAGNAYEHKLKAKSDGTTG